MNATGKIVIEINDESGDRVTTIVKNFRLRLNDTYLSVESQLNMVAEGLIPRISMEFDKGRKPK